MLVDTPKLAWRNLGRNLRRTLVTGAALAFGISLCVATYGLMDGVNAQMLHALTRYDIGHVQVHTPAFAQRRALDRRIVDPANVIALAEQQAGVRGVAARVYAFALVSGAGKSAGVELVGVDPDREVHVTELHQQIHQGRYLDSEATPWPEGRALTEEERARDALLTAAAEERALAEIDELDGLDDDAVKEATHVSPELDGDERKSTDLLAHAVSPPPARPLRVIIGVNLARVMGVSVGGELYASTLTVDGQSEAAFMEVAGVFETGTQLHDRNRIYLHIDDLRRLTHLGVGAHEVALTLDNIQDAAAVSQTLTAALPGDRHVVRSWKKVRPNMEQMLALNDVSTNIMVFIIFIVATLGVVNTMLMSVFERTRELGVLKAIGMSGGRIVLLILLEALFLVMVASVVGTAMGLALDGYMVKYGVDLTNYTEGFSMAGVGFKPIIYGVITWRGLWMPTAVLSVMCLLASIYPAVRAARMQPAVGMRAT
jgi:ABC-type lipoprotein release transport system permease subunit